MIEKTGDTLLQKRVKYMVDGLGDCQQKLGGNYLSAFPESDFTTLENNSANHCAKEKRFCLVCIPTPIYLW
ncbi:MAG TPA: hypothetical protein VI413_08950, partial [Paludibacter sp.]